MFIAKCFAGVWVANLHILTFHLAMCKTTSCIGTEPFIHWMFLKDWYDKDSAQTTINSNTTSRERVCYAVTEGQN